MTIVDADGVAVTLLLVVLVVLSLPVVPASAVASLSTSSPDDALEHRVSQSTVATNTPPVREGDYIVSENTTNRLALDGETRQAYATPAPNLGTTLATQDGTMRLDYELFVLEEYVRNESLDQDQRVEAFLSTLEHFDGRLETLREREQAIVAEHAEGEASDQDVLRTIARNYGEALELQGAIERLGELSLEVVGDSPDHVGAYTAELDVYLGPARERAAETVRGDRLDDRLGDDASPHEDAITIETAANGTGFVVSTIDGGEYVRETTRYDNRDVDGANQFDDIPDAQSTAEEHYPWAFESNTGRTSYVFPEANLYRIQAVNYDHGSQPLTVFLDSATRGTYYERQVLALEQLPVGTETTLTSSDNLSVTLEQTEAAGPVKATVTDEAGESLEATVTVDGTDYGETGTNGELWFDPPAGDGELVVEAGGGAVNETVQFG